LVAPDSNMTNPNDYNADMAELIKKFTAAMTDSKQTRIKEPNVYDGTRDALLIDGWIRSVERFINFNGWTPERRGVIIVNCIVMI
jgi:hypothetical protein